MSRLYKEPLLRSHFLLLIVFFLTHGYYEYAGLIPVADMVLYLLLVSCSAVMLFLLFSYFFQNQHKGAIFTTAGIALYLFYGAIQDTLRMHMGLPSISAHRYLIPLVLTGLTALFIFLNRSVRPFRRASMYLTTVLMVCIIIDGIKIAYRLSTPGPVITAQNRSALRVNLCDTCSRPDIYFIILDEYCGSRVLKEYFQYDNSRFENYLRSAGFYVPATPSSNYSITPLSMAATFDMNYLTWDRDEHEIQSYAKAARLIPVSNSIHLLQLIGYRLQNYSIFDLADQPSAFETGFLPMKLKLITATTFAGRVKRDFFWRVQVRNKGTDNMLKWIAADTREGNEGILSLTEAHSRRASKQPAFVYSHLIMPHAPFAVDSTGRERFVNFADPSLSEAEKKDGYLQYLVYTNKRIEALVNTLHRNTNRKAVIILLSDHGYRESPAFSTCSDVNNNFSAVFIPEGNYENYYDSISNVNQFRALFNTLFKTRLELLQDACRY